jgi:hypothetical protein
MNICVFKLSISYRSFVSFNNIFGDKKAKEDKTAESKNEKSEFENEIIFKEFDAVKNTEYIRLFIYYK